MKKIISYLLIIIIIVLIVLGIRQGFTLLKDRGYLASIITSNPTPSGTPIGSGTPGVCCVAVYDTCTSIAQRDANAWLNQQTGCAAKISTSLTNIVQNGGFNLGTTTQCSSVRLSHFAHGPNINQYRYVLRVCLKDFKCDLNTYSTSCSTFNDLDAALAELIKLQKNIEPGVTVTITGNQSTAFSCYSGSAPTPVQATFTVTRDRISCQVGPCGKTSSFCKPIGTKVQCIPPNSTTSVYQYCCSQNNVFYPSSGYWETPGRTCDRQPAPVPTPLKTPTTSSSPIPAPTPTPTPTPTVAPTPWWYIFW